MKALHPQAQRVTDIAAAAGVQIDVIEYPEATRTALDAAIAIGCDVDQIVKSMIFKAEEGIVLALTSGSWQVDPKALAVALGVARCGRADADEVRQATGYAIGGVPPFGHATALPSVVDTHLLGFPTIWAGGGTPRHVFAISPDDLLRLSGATPAAFTR